MATACVAPATVVPAAPLRVWPHAPDLARVVFVQAFSRAQDLGIQKGFWQQIGDVLFGAEDHRMVRPMAVVDAGGVLYVADPGVRGVHRFDREAGRHDILRGRDGNPLPSPVGLAIGAAGAVYVTDSVLKKIFVIAVGADHAQEVNVAAGLQQPTGVASDHSSGDLFVTDTAAHKVLVLGPSGDIKRSIGERGTGDGQFNFPTMLWRDAAGLLYVSDTLNFRVQIFATDGRFKSSFGRHGDGSGDLARHKGIATDSHGHIYVVDGLLHAVQVFDGAGRLLLGIGNQGREHGEFWLPAGIFVSKDNMIYVADAYNQRVQVFRFLGAPS